MSKAIEFVGTAMGDTIGLVIANVDKSVLEKMNFETKYRSIGIIGGRTGAGPHIMAADEAVKATNTEIVSIQLARDTKGGAGHGNLIIFGSDDVSDSRRAFLMGNALVTGIVEKIGIVLLHNIDTMK